MADLQSQSLKAHNSARAEYGALPLQWNETLQTKAQDWANNCVTKHS